MDGARAWHDAQLPAGGGLNAAIGLTAIFASRRAAGDAAGATELRTSNSELHLPPRWTIGVIVLLSGFVALALEVVWFRVLAAIILRPTTYAFTIMLAAVLGGIGLGSYVAGSILRRSRRWGLWLAAAEIGTGVLALLSFRGTAWSFDVMRWTEEVIARYLPDHLAPLLVGTFVSIFPVALMMGIALPIALAAWTAGGGHPGRRLGNVYALNVAGSIAGSLAGGFVLLPLLGSHRSLVLLSVLMIAGACLLLLRLERRWQTARRHAAARHAADAHDGRPERATRVRRRGPDPHRRSAPRGILPLAAEGRSRHRPWAAQGRCQAAAHKIGSVPIF